MHKNTETASHIWNISLQAFLADLLLSVGISCLLYGIVNSFLPLSGWVLLILLAVFCLVLYYPLYQIIYEHYVNRWIENHKGSWIDGSWLHIHAKKNSSIRFGTVAIHQEFNSITAHGRNYGFDRNGKHASSTTWRYLTGRTFDDDTPRDVIACYTADNHGSVVTRDGVHTMTIDKNYSDFPKMMYGSFRNTFSLYDDKIRDLGDNFGKIYMYRPSKELENFLFSAGQFQKNKVEEALKDSSFDEEPFIVQLRELLQEREAQEARQKQKNLIHTDSSPVDYFISYSKEDGAEVQRIVDALEKRGERCWIYERDSAGLYNEAILEALKNARIFLLFASENSLPSSQVNYEVSLISSAPELRDSLPVIPVVLDDALDARVWPCQYFLSGWDRVDARGQYSLDQLAETICTKKQKLIQKKEQSHSK